MVITHAALDVYGTMLACYDHTGTYPPRDGLEYFLDECDKRGIKVVTSSDANIIEMKQDLEEVFKSTSNPRLNLKRFDRHFQLEGAKDFSIVYGYYDITPRELLVIGDSYKDANAERHGCKFVHCPMYSIDEKDDWSFSTINLDSFK